MRTYVFRVELDQDEDGRWSASIPTLPGCGTWGKTAEEALETLKEASQAYIEVLIEDGRPLPVESNDKESNGFVHVINAPVISATL